MDAEEAYVMARYGELDYSVETARRLVTVAEELYRLLRGVAERVRMG